MNGRSRLFGFVGFKTNEMAEEAKKYFHQTYLHTSKLDVDFAKSQDDPNLERPWSRHSLGSSAYNRNMIQKGKTPLKAGGAKSNQNGNTKEEVEKKKARFREFLKLVGKSKDNNKQSWNDQFESFMETD